MPVPNPVTKRAAVIGGGPAGLMAAERIARAGCAVTVFERMPSPGRKFLMAGRGGLNITHSEDAANFLLRYGEAQQALAPVLESFSAQDLRRWCEELGQETFVGSSGRIFPKSMKASPLLRAWLRRLDQQGVEIRLRHSFRGWNASGELLIEDASGSLSAFAADAMVLAMGGASWPRLGSDGGWVEALRARGISVASLQPSNCGFDVEWSPHLRERFAGAPLKNVVLRFGERSTRGEMTVTTHGVEGGAVYALSPMLRDAIARDGAVVVHIDLRPDTDADTLMRKLSSERGKASLSNHLRKRAGLTPLEIALLHETHAPFAATGELAKHIKSVPVRLTRARPIERAISSAGGVAFSELDADFMLAKVPGAFCAGEMIDWEAPTGGYLLQACFATGFVAGEGAASWLSRAKA
jgi:uncharacterized flavoprotein (TIGR03862 family)